MASVSSAAPLHSCADESDRIREIVVDIDNLCVVPTTLATLLGAAGETRVLTVEVGGYSLLTVSCNIYNHDATQSCVMLYLFQKKILYDAPSESNRQPPPMQRKSPNKPELY
jgi:hypothetical protein